jgi:hypothetical protein
VLRREIAYALIVDSRGRLLLQQCDAMVGILHPVKVGLFGGHREGNETLLAPSARFATKAFVDKEAG